MNVFLNLYHEVSADHFNPEFHYGDYNETIASRSRIISISNQEKVITTTELVER